MLDASTRSVRPSRRIIEKERIAQIAMVAPTTRLLAVIAEVWPDDEGRVESEVYVVPIVVIRSVVSDQWARPERRDNADHRETLGGHRGFAIRRATVSGGT